MISLIEERTQSEENRLLKKRFEPKGRKLERIT
jgi:hypothetical protein